MKKHRVAILTEIIAPYRIPVFNILAKDLDVELDVLFFAETESRRSWQIPKEKIKFNYKVLKGFIVGKSLHNDSIFFNPSIVAELIKGKYDTIIVGGFHHPTIWLSFFYACITKKRFILHSESTLGDIRSSNVVKNWLKKFFVKHCSGYIIPGMPQKRYLLSLGADNKKIWIAPNSVDSKLFKKALEERKNNKENTKEAMGIKGDVILYVGRMIHAKGVQDLIEAFAEIKKSFSDISLVLVGEGPDRRKYEEMCCQKSIEGVIFTGFIEQENLPKYYTIADVFIFPTHSDTWGMVINEAMLSDLPVICSKKAGAAEDLIKANKNGLIHEPGDIAGISCCVARLLGDKKLAEDMGRRSREVIASYSPEDMALGIRNAVFAKKEYL